MAGSWTATKTWSASNVLTAAEMNTYVGASGNLQWVKDALSLHGITSSSANGQLAGALMGARVTRASNQSVGDTGAFIAIAFPTEAAGDPAWDSDGMHSTVSNNSRLTVPSGGDGYWQIESYIEVEANATGYRRAKICKNGGTEGAGTDEDFANELNPTAGIAAALKPGVMLKLVAGDYIEVKLRQTSTAARNVNTGSYLYMWRVFAS